MQFLKFGGNLLWVLPHALSHLWFVYCLTFHGSYFSWWTHAISKIRLLFILISVIKDLSGTNFQPLQLELYPTGVLIHLCMHIFATIINVYTVLCSINHAWGLENCIGCTLGDDNLHNGEDISAHRNNASIQ